ncbi:MAG: hypothetical protein HQL15_09490, partial [Candidatus Omnitrophica bacterium]|nr:hypothetical protein [Candidatus Omnitrophota bacterium]
RKEYYRRFLSDDGVVTRTFGVERVSQVLNETCDESTKRFEQVSVELATRAGQECLESEGLEPHQIDGLIVVTCTGYLCPGLTSYVVESLGLRSDIYVLDMVGHGCGAALPALRNAQQFLSSRPKSNLLLITVEVCSAAFFDGDAVDLMISNSIFGDGAAACLLTTEDKPGWSLESHQSMMFPQFREDLRFKMVNGRLNNVLSRNVPQIVAYGVKELLKQMRLEVLPELLAFHTGGRAILDRLQVELGLSSEALEGSRRVLSQYGNMSSPCVLYVLKQFMDERILDDGTEALMLSYGAGVAVNATQIRWSV